jgi:glycosyltransferase involved in cell wall biosynthesis
MKISYSILTHNESTSLQKLLDFLIKYKDDSDEIVILDDYSDREETKEILDVYTSIYDVKVEQRHLFAHFANQKNHLKKMCTGDYIFNLDADEIPKLHLIRNIKAILEINEQIDLILVPRINTIDGLTSEHIQKWGWAVDERGWVNFPDWQGRIHKNRPNIRWKNAVHEVMEGYKEYSFLPPEEEYCIVHHKVIDKQEKQNEFYRGIN